MTNCKKITIVAGARPNFMKIAPIIKEIESRNNRTGELGGKSIEWTLIHTGQHYDEKMSEVFFKELGIAQPHVNLEIGSGSHAEQTAHIMIKFEKYCLEEKPDWVVVVGDVNSTLACTLVCAKLCLKVAHVEAGLRSFDRTMPEEINRIVTDSLADLLLTPSPDGDENLLKEGVPQSRIKLVGNIMIDSLVSNLERSRNADILERLGLSKKEFVFVTLHRPSNVDRKDSLETIVNALKRLSQRFPIVFPIHPRTKKMLQAHDIDISDIKNMNVIEPIGYHDCLCLSENARLVLTDSGGLQEETTFFRSPCLTLRPNTERPVTITLGSNKLTTIQTLDEDIQSVLEREDRFGEVPPLWDGKTAGRIVDLLTN